MVAEQAGALREVGAFFERLKDHSFKATPQRKAIAEAVFETHGHFTADELFRLAKKKEPLVGRVTVYRTLSHLVELGMVEEMAMQKGVATYEHVFGHPHHDHVVCRSCGALEDLVDPALEKALLKAAEARGWQVLGHDLSIKGLCPKCSKNR